MQYVQLDIFLYAASILAAVHQANETLYSETQPCEEPAAYLIPDATRAGAGGQDVEQRPAMVCREHLEEMLGHAPEDQPIFRRFQGSGE